MTTTTQQTKRWLLRVVVCALLLVGLPIGPAVVMVLAAYRDPPYPAIILWMVFSLIPSWFIARRIMSRASYTCPRCGGCKARFERSAETLDLICPACGFRDPRPGSKQERQV